jgi:GNAT superfamily N-acetyltransferase
MGLLAPMFVYDGLAFVQELFVVDDRRGQGHGRDLMTAFHAVAAARGMGVAALATRRAGAFYEALGYTTSAAYYRRDLR